VLAEPPIAFRVDPEQAGVVVLVNFGIFAGREATAAEVDALALLLRPELGEISIVSELRHEISRHSEAAIHQVRIEVTPENLPPGPDGREQAGDLIVRTADLWARLCVAERHTEL
jgi:hypothetical protein